MKHIFFALVTFFLMPYFAFAQNCTVQSDVIVRLKPPKFGTPTLMESALGSDVENMMITDVVANNKDDIIVTGIQENLKDSAAPKAMFVASIDRRGRVNWMKTYNVTDLKSVVGIKQLANQTVVIVVTQKHKKPPATTMVVLDSNYKLLKKKIVDRHLDAVSFVKTPKGFMIAGNAMNDQMSVARIIGVTLDNAISFQRLYTPGGATTLNNIKHISGDLYAATGHMTASDKRQAGWLMMVNGRGEVLWQQQYPRGEAARILDAIPLNNGDIMINGQIVAIDDGTGSAAWVASLNGENGAVKWERFVTTDNYHLAAKNTIVQKSSGLFYTMARAKPERSTIDATDSLARLMAFNERGELIKVQDFSANKGIVASGMVQTLDGSGMIYGATQHDAQGESVIGMDNLDPVEYKMAHQKGWMVRMPLSINYNDPCAYMNTPSGASDITIQPNTSSVFP